MARKKAHEEHANHEAWAIPYGDLVTLLLALFVVLYSMSSVNEGKFRVLSESLNAAFNGKPRTVKPIEIGNKPQVGKGPADRTTIIPRQGGTPPGVSKPIIPLAALRSTALRSLEQKTAGDVSNGNMSLKRMADAVDQALGDLIERKLVTVRRSPLWLEIEIRTDILFPSGVADLSTDARPVLAQLAAILKPFPNPIRIEGHTDDRPIRTATFPSNWQLSAGRAASVVALFMQDGVDPVRMSVAGFGEYHPAADNATSEGRNRNRRVLIVVLGADDDALAGELTSHTEPTQGTLTASAGPAASNGVAASYQAAALSASAPVHAQLEATP